MNNLNIEYGGLEELKFCEKFLPKYNADIVKNLSEFRSYYGDKVLDFGAGIGTLSKIWSSKLNISPDCIEIDPLLCRFLSKRGFKIIDLNYTIHSQKYDHVFTSNVLEHIEDDVGALKELRKMLKPRGTISIFVPAFQILYSHIDHKVGHKRRYSVHELKTKLQVSGFDLISAYYYDSIGFFLWFAFKIMRQEDSTKSVLSKYQLILFDLLIFPISIFFDKFLFMKYFVGKNIFIHAIKRES